MSLIRIPKGPPPQLEIKRIVNYTTAGLNMVYIVVDCPHCGKEHRHFNHLDRVFSCYIGRQWKYTIKLGAAE